MPHLQDLARALGLSTSTVSRALRNHPAISAETVRRVQDEAERQSYRPNPHVSLVMSHMRRSGPLPYQATLAWVDSFVGINDWKASAPQRQFFSGAEARAHRRGYRLERFHVRAEGLTPDRVMSIFQARGILGALCPEPTAISDGLVDPARIATVTVGFRSESPALHFSTNDQYATARTAHRVLQERGRRRIGFVSRRYLEEIVDYRFTAGYLSVAVACDEMAAPPFLVDEKSAAAFRTWVLDHDFDALLVTVVPELSELLACLPKKKRGSLFCATLDWQKDLPDLPGLRQDHERVGAAAVDLLIGQLERNETGLPENAQGTLVESVWHEEFLPAGELS